MADTEVAAINPELTESFETLRLKLLDTSKRNPLTSVNLGAARAKQVLIDDELSEQIFKILYREEKTFSFLPREESEADLTPTEESELEDPDETVYVPEEQTEELKASHTDTKFQTNLTPADLHKRLLSLYREAKSVEEDLGVNVLYLALGFLHYFESEASGVERTAPVLLLPVELKRDSSKAMFKLVAREDDLVTNQSLARMLKEEFDVLFPTLPSGDEWTAGDYFETLDSAITAKPRWFVAHDEMLLRFFSFEKYMMSRELEESTLEQFSTQNGDGVKLVSQLFSVSGSNETPSSSNSPSLRAEITNLDEQFDDPRELGHILDADTSQTHVISAAMDGQNLVVQGPPGTGKSQTITNIIGTAIAQGKRVLFVAEKKAALDVVYKRLEACGLGHMCLELHSHKTNRKHFYQDLKSTLEPVNIPPLDEGAFAEIKEVRDRLNRLTELVHQLDETGNTPYLLMGRIAQLTGKGIKPSDLEIEQIGSWKKEEFETRLNVVASLSEQIQRVGKAVDHPWYGISNRLSPLDQSRLEDLLKKQLELCGSQKLSTWEFVESHFADSLNTLSQRRQLLAQLTTLGSAPAEFMTLLGSSVIDTHLQALAELISEISEYQATAAELESQVIELAFESEWEIDANIIRQHGGSFLKFLSSSYRAAAGRLKNVLKSAKLPAQEERVTLVDRLEKCSQLRRSIRDRSSLGNEYFGVSWADQKTDIEHTHQCTQWLQSHIEEFESVEQVRDIFRSITEEADLNQLLKDLAEANGAWEANWQQIDDLLGIKVSEAFSSDDIGTVAIDRLVDRINVWLTSFGKLNEYYQLTSTINELTELGLGDVVDALNHNRLQPETAVDSVMLLRSEVVLEAAFERQPELENIDGSTRTALVEEFKSHDKRLQTLAAQEVVIKHDQQMPRGYSGQIGLLRGEANKKSRHIPIRQALDNAGEALQLIKPVFLMSPMSISRFLTPGGLKFDMLLIDEASQVKPEEALGAMLRASQVVVVGDQKQMPPTSFFDKQVSDEPVETDEEATIESLTRSQLGAMESVLSLCEARGLPSAMLSWHYRSEHPSLIEVSNHEFYDSKLIYPPTPNFGSGNVGLQLVKTDGVYARAKGRNNPIDAQRVCEGILEHVSQYPGQSLGVVALSTSQRDTIQNKLDEMCRDHPELDQFCYAEHDESLFVKNLENVQGDERDVIFVSIGYGPDETGKFLQNFGPVSSDGGERRLNVLFTRARKRCVIYSSISHDQIRDDIARYAGPRVLKQFLKFAETGEMDVAVITGDEMDSPFEQDVAQVIKDHGYQVEAQVGAAGFKIDLAVYDPDQEGHFLLAVECDGARYHSSSWARERDRLRQEVLEHKGWRFHRIWSTDWFYSRQPEVAKLIEAIERARSHRTDSKSPAETAVKESQQQDFRQTIEVSEEEIASQPRVNVETKPYQEADILIPDKSQEIHQVTSEVLTVYLKNIVQVEQPIHRDLLAHRLSRLWEKKRVGSRITDAVEEAYRDLLRFKMVEEYRADPLYLVLSNTGNEFGIRDRTDVELSLLKDAQYIPSNEIQQVIDAIVHASVAIELEDCAKEVGRVLGTSVKQKSLLDKVAKVAQRMEIDSSIDFDGTTLRRRT